VNIVDTAGIRTETETTDPIEREGIRRALEKADNAHLIILVLEPTAERIGEKEVENLLTKFNHQKIIICVNKSDLIGENEFERRRIEKGMWSFIKNYNLIYFKCSIRKDITTWCGLVVCGKMD
jgi:tRNA U34 5-carboxymethylaminomethyl modifying GTPase MnmE/TrmE